MHNPIDPAILYFGTPVVLVSSENEDGSANVAPISSAWWLGKYCMLGFGARSKTPANILRTGQCVLNLPSVDQVSAVDRLARTTGSDPVPAHKVQMGYRHEKDKIGLAGFQADPSALVRPPRLRQCPVQLEAVLERAHPLADSNPEARGLLVGIEVKIVRVHVEDSIRMAGHQDRIDPDLWRPLMMSFCQFYGLGERVHSSRLAEIPESAYRGAKKAPAPVPVFECAEEANHVHA